MTFQCPFCRSVNRCLFHLLDKLVSLGAAFTSSSRFSEVTSLRIMAKLETWIRRSQLPRPSFSSADTNDPSPITLGTGAYRRPGGEWNPRLPLQRRVVLLHKAIYTHTHVCTHMCWSWVTAVHPQVQLVIVTACKYFV